MADSQKGGPHEETPQRPLEPPRVPERGDPEDTVRFYALRLHEAGMIKSSPQKILAQGTDWRIWQELKKELKA